jgi:hypothetical protein
MKSNIYKKLLIISGSFCSISEPTFRIWTFKRFHLVFKQNSSQNEQLNLSFLRQCPFVFTVIFHCLLATLLRSMRKVILLHKELHMCIFRVKICRWPICSWTVKSLIYTLTKQKWLFSRVHQFKKKFHKLFCTMPVQHAGRLVYSLVFGQI